MAGDETLEHVCESAGVQSPRATHRNVYVRSWRAGERVMASITRFLTERLRLTVNGAKSAVDRPWNRSFLGHTVTNHMRPRLRVAARSVDRLRDKLRSAFCKGRGWSMAYSVDNLAPILRGWINYFRLAQVTGPFEELDGWVRRKLRCILWRQWKQPRTRAKKLTRRGLEEARAWQAAFTGRGPWWNAGASHMHDAYRKAHFDKLGLLSLLDQHRRLNHAS
jgi:RNA-directed DNA polymerase